MVKLSGVRFHCLNEMQREAINLERGARPGSAEGLQRRWQSELTREI